MVHWMSGYVASINFEAESASGNDIDQGSGEDHPLDITHSTLRESRLSISNRYIFAPPWEFQHPSSRNHQSNSTILWTLLDCEQHRCGCWSPDVPVVWNLRI